MVNIENEIKSLENQLSEIERKIKDLKYNFCESEKSEEIDFSKYTVVSFDVFDTVILRPFARPIDAFALVGGTAFANAPQKCRNRRASKIRPRGQSFRNLRLGFRSIWEKINGRESWAANPRVVAIGFKVLEMKGGDR